MAKKKRVASLKFPDPPKKTKKVSKKSTIKRAKKNSKNSKKKLASIQRTDYDIAYDFATKAYQKFREVIKSIVLFGSVAKTEAKPESDIDIIIIVDDCAIAWDQELIAWYREELGKLIVEQNYEKKIHVNTITLSTFWDELRAGLPIIINIIRYGQPLIDFGGFFDPLKVLLAKGRIRPTPEAVFVTLKRAPEHIARARLDILNTVENLYWAVVDSAHAALMACNQIPPSPEHIPEMMQNILVKNRLINKKLVEDFKRIRNLAKNILYGYVKEIKGKDIDFYTEMAENFEKEMRKITTKLIEKEKIIKIEEKKV